MASAANDQPMVTALVVSTSAKSQQRQHRAHHKASRGDTARSHRALGRALDVFVKVAVSHIVDAAARTAHQDRAQREHRQQMPARKPAREPPTAH
jgi:hypothetical protein